MGACDEFMLMSRRLPDLDTIKGNGHPSEIISLALGPKVCGGGMSEQSNKVTDTGILMFELVTEPTVILYLPCSILNAAIIYNLAQAGFLF
jgi:hypothetical protein